MRFEQFDKVADLIENGPGKLKRSDTTITPASSDFMNRDEKAKYLDKIRKETFHNNVVKAIVLSKRSRQYIQPTVAVLATRVRDQVNLIRTRW